MTLIVFDLDGTLLNKRSELSEFTQLTLKKLQQNDIAFTIATGRTFNSAQALIANQPFLLPQVYSNGVILWEPQNNRLHVENCLSIEDMHFILDTTASQQITPFISAVNERNQHFIFHPNTIHEAEKKLLRLFQSRNDLIVLPVADLTQDVLVTNVSMIGDGNEIDSIHYQINTQTHLIAYSGPAVEGHGLKWMDIHHNAANKGNGITQLRKRISTEHVICFGDSDNDLSMFRAANESYAMENAKAPIKEAASGVIGHHDDDGVARYLTERFDL